MDTEVQANLRVFVEEVIQMDFKSGLEMTYTMEE